ncbi:MAG TPA: RagB/SusD family nutrient uptake outer membrane protein [Porphyromonadaceae bacterium]|nr:RagB/SusD family nutrient uptake outer membrane protein [Porphyromonadaceae bacterium]
MKTVQYYFIFFCIACVVLAGCNDNQFLEENPKSIYTIDNAFDKSSQVEAQLTMCYVKMYGWYIKTNNPWTSNYQHKSFGTDVLDAPYWRYNGGARSNFGTWGTTSDWVSSIWNDWYQIISYANLTLMGAEMERVTWSSEDQKKQVIAEAKFFKGLAYLRLGELYGGVPIVDEYSEELKFDYVRSTRAETFQFAIDNLKAAYDNLPNYPPLDGRLGKGAAAHMLAEAHLAMGVESGNNSNYASAITYANATIELHPLMTARFGVRANPAITTSNRNTPTYFPTGNVYGDLFFPGNFDRSEGNTEAVWVIQTPTYEQYDATGGQRSSAPQFFSFVARDVNWAPEYMEEGAAAGPWKGERGAEYNTATNPAHTGGFGIAEAAGTNYVLYDVWTDPTDLRYQEDVTVRTTYICMNPPHSMYGKRVSRDMLDQNPNNITKFSPTFSKIIPLDEWSYRNTDQQHGSFNTDGYAIRSGETYLLLAEAYLRNGQKDLAAQAVNTVRRRAQCTNMCTQDEVDIDVILDERIRECLFEEGRWFTLLRMEPDVWKKRIYNYAMYTKDFPIYTLQIKWNLWPIPQNIIDLNVGAEFPQNPGW